MGSPGHPPPIQLLLFTQHQGAATYLSGGESSMGEAYERGDLSLGMQATQ